MTLGSQVNAALSWAADRSVIGTLTSIAALGVVTAPAAAAAGAEAGRQDSLSEAVPTFLRTFKRHLRVGTGPGAVAAVLLASAAVSLMWAASATADAERVLAYALGLQTLLAAIATSAAAASLLDAGAPPSARNILVLVAMCPGSFAALGCLVAVALAVASLAPVLALPVVGVMTGSIAEIRVKYQRRRSLSATLPS
ncbi:hypothetical protein [Rathayibacter festucae]|uniref:hypothetical protein n=1 Tax=Rathayibacter festucae TaxID=110937 RepID=UPI002A69FCAB|nr:hypothetical protein [Rathayibacter festucae]MDY0914559.1 hypothetical protein [Rathayibacter festucae]